MRARFLEAGGVIFEGAAFQSAEVYTDGVLMKCACFPSPISHTYKLNLFIDFWPRSTKHCLSPFMLLVAGYQMARMPQSQPAMPIGHWQWTAAACTQTTARLQPCSMPAAMGWPLRKAPTGAMAAEQLLGWLRPHTAAGLSSSHAGSSWTAWWDLPSSTNFARDLFCFLDAVG